MYNITLVGTIHSESGKCNPDELYKILEDLDPEVIFDELPVHYADMYYRDSFDLYCANRSLLYQPEPSESPEVKCIKKYKQNHIIEIVPVDIDIRQRLAEHKQEILFLFQTFFKHEAYKELDTEKDALIESEGFHFLNSNKFLAYLEKKKDMEKSIMEAEAEKDRLFTIYQLFHAENYDNRENKMLENIYKYSKANPYNQAVFLIGAQHRKSIMQKIAALEKQSELKLNWKMYANK